MSFSISSLVSFLALFLNQISYTLARPLFSHNGEFSTNQIYQFPNGSWVENIAVRQNGDLLLTRLDVPELYSLDPAHPIPTLVHRFTNATALLGIAEVSRDRFAVLVGNYSHVAGATPRTFSIWTLDFNKVSSSKDPIIFKAASIPQITFPNGMASPSENLVIITDTDAGALYGADLTTGESYIVSTDPLLAPVANPLLGNVGANGVQIRNSYAYFSTSGSNILGRFPIASNGTQTGPGEVLAHALYSYDLLDDFTYDSFGNLYVASATGNTIQKVTRDARVSVIAGTLNSTTLAQPTSAKFGKRPSDRGVLYVTTGGGEGAPVNGDVIVGAQVVAVDLSKWI